jgi:Cu/Ag efflux protein CusF
MHRAAAILLTLALGALLVWTPAAMAQTPQTAPPSSSAPASSAPAGDKHMEGKVKSLDPTGKKLTLVDGTEFMIPATVKISRTELRPGANVKVSYEEQGGQKVLKSLEVEK